MAMQTDVLSAHITLPRVATASAVRLKGITVSPATASLRSTAVADPTVYKSGTYVRTSPSTTLTATVTAHGLTTGDRVFMNFTTGGATNGVYAITKTNANVFTITTAASSTIATSNVTFYSTLLLELDTYNIIGLPIRIPGEGIYCPNGMFVGVGSSVTATVFYG